MLRSLFAFIFYLFIHHFLYAQTDYQTLHKNSLVVDTHTDVLLRVLQGADIAQRLDQTHVDLVRLREGGVDVQFFAVWPNPTIYRPGRMFEQSIRMIDALERIIAHNPEKITLVGNPQQVMKALQENKLAACIGVEGGTAIENDLTKLEQLFERGVRYLGLTWNDSPDWASSGKDEISSDFKGQRGLSEFGRQVVRRMNELGMIVDISHSGEQTFWDVIEISSKPVIASHSCVYQICPSYRNLKDEQLKALAANGGVIFITFYPGYLQKGFESRIQHVIKSTKTELDSVKQIFGNDHLAFRSYRKDFLDQQSRSFRPGIEQVVDHIDYVVQLVGDDHVGLGSDFDGISLTPVGLKDVGDIPQITRAMVERGYSEERIGKILGGNFMRVFKAVSSANQ